MTLYAFRASPGIGAALDKLVENGTIATRSDGIRDAVLDYLRTHQVEVPA